MISVNERNYILHLQAVNRKLVEALEDLEQTAGLPTMRDDPVRVRARAALAMLQSESNVSQA